MERRRYYLSVAILVVLNSVVLGLIWHTYQARSRKLSGHPQHLVYGEASPTATVYDITGQRVSLPQPGEYSVILFFDPHNTQEARSRLIKYADVLNERYGHQGLSCVTVAHSRREDLSEWAGAHKITYPLIADEDGNLHERFLFGQEAGGTLIVDPDGIVRFSYHALIDADLLRQLTEKFILGQVNVAAGQIDLTVFQPGRQMPEVEALELRTGALVPLASEMVHQKLVVVFTADCASCQLNHYIGQLKQLEQQLSPPSKPQATVALFSRSFSEVEVLDHLRAQGITSPVYLATDDIPGLEDPYNTRFDVTRTGPLVVRLDKRGRIVNTVSIDEVLKEGKDAIH